MRTILRIPLGWLYAGLLALNSFAVARYTHSCWASIAVASGLALIVLSIHVAWRVLSASVAGSRQRTGEG